MKAVLLISGGMDSLVTTAITAAKGLELAAMHVNYGQRTWKRELDCFRLICNRYGITERLEIDAGYLAAIGGSSLTDTAMPVGNADLQGTSIPTSYVPFRNAGLLSMAVSWAEVIGAERICIGAVEEDSSGYPDCRQAFYDAFNKVIELGTRPETGIRIETPLIAMQKSQIVLKGMELEAPFEYSWSCYKNEGKACGICDSCARRLRAFELTGIRDPIDYEKRPKYI
ncbi:MAG: 7-cyano-7-deazaguanine synthase QueC [Chlorobium sp.]|uniref:7-cyano-7-deazaguanine synthase QueC n=1 Tax=Chlorobium sp. TaxID=1095 RepID=UPI001DDADE16|nr:7-cyano-7-deazaguanine synthase QueC [Chlorobium sp.]MBN1278646.1 7-cyano-7-deazaguanine synthase QueC [Chlorobiaceae bacterium]MCF8217068.1 7-cyano-7-deazaguanine synthase QueC [Chlorobium sp.]MCF8271881.1 7-cyano-7-deazaguanine synthase QueC [Chlorobium sp.]MCF8288285.1 7-cyano-7-deazaguanine synthase QueC [Chlorobium sp.]MCF8291843.1 7-cyano-7-deazaguanine synthase QueC [Chlorobium sp.]